MAVLATSWNEDLRRAISTVLCFQKSPMNSITLVAIAILLIGGTSAFSVAQCPAYLRTTNFSSLRSSSKSSLSAVVGPEIADVALAIQSSTSVIAEGMKMGDFPTTFITTMVFVGLFGRSAKFAKGKKDK